MPNLIANLNRVLRYSMDTVENLLQQLHETPESRYPQHKNADPSNNEHTLFRHVVADALEESGRSGEAQLLRDNAQHVVVRNGRVRAGRVGYGETRSAYNAVHGLLDPHDTGLPYLDWHNDYTKPGVEGMVTAFQLYPNRGSPGRDGVTMHRGRLSGYLADHLEAEYKARGLPSGSSATHRDVMDAIDRLRSTPSDQVDPSHLSEQ